jgi:predicted Zn-dependent peptidase
VSSPDIEPVFEAERERAAISAERAADAPGFQARLLFDRALYGETHPLARRATAASIRAISLDDVRALYRSRYRLPYLALAISGRVQREDVEAAMASGFRVVRVSRATPTARSRHHKVRRRRSPGALWSRGISTSGRRTCTSAARGSPVPRTIMRRSR